MLYANIFFSARFVNIWSSLPNTVLMLVLLTHVKHG